MSMRQQAGHAGQPEHNGINRVAVLYHPKIPATHALAEQIGDWLEARSVSAWLALSWSEEQVRGALHGTDLIIVLGGDGSTLRAARMAAGFATPILGVNMGRLGFLSELTPETWSDRLPEVLEGRYWVEERMMLKAETWRDSALIDEHLALNDVVVSRGCTGARGAAQHRDRR